MLEIATLVWVGLMVLAWFYVQRHKRPEAKPVAAYLIFITILSTVAMLLFVGLSYLLTALGFKPVIDTMLGGALLLAAVLAPAFHAARVTLALRPSHPPIPD